MANFFRKARQSLSPQRKSPRVSQDGEISPVLANQPPFPSVLPPKLSIPAVLHPSPYREICITVTPDGLLLYPALDAAATRSPANHVRIPWGSGATIKEEAHDPTTLDGLPSVTVVGLLGTLDLFQCPYIFVITSKTDVGDLYKESHAVYCVKSVAAVPLANEALASAVVKALAAKIPAKSTRSDAVSSAVSELPSPNGLAPDIAVTEGTPTAEGPQVRFIEPQSGLSRSSTVTDDAASISTSVTTSLMLPPDPAFEPLASGQTTPASTASGSRSNSPLSSSIVNKLSFWKKKRQMTSDSIESTASTMTSVPEEADPPDESSRGDILGNILAKAPQPATPEEKRNQLEAKVVKQVIWEFTRGTFFFAYDFDMTRSLQHKHEALASQHHNKSLLSDLGARNLGSPSEEPPLDSPLAEPASNLPLWRRVDKKFWWTEHMTKLFTDAGLHNYVLPVVQGFVQIATFQMPDNDAPGDSSQKKLKIKYTIISRRSKERAGLRYQRRGIDDDGNIANFVETETVAQVKREGIWNLFSHVQIRGSIPLFWSQPGLNLKPPPVLDRPVDQSMDAVRHHFDRITGVYGPVTAVNVAELTGKEATVTSPYREAVAALKNPLATYQEFDFHRECAGMHYENITKLVSRLERTFESQGFFWVSGSIVLSKQKGAFRVNCIDCLDRTNVVMSAFSRHVLLSQLEAVALIHDRSQTNGSEMDTVFNDVWANNGDAISRAYAGTSALKGDYTRTGRRDLGGILNDGMNSVMRMYSSTFSDYFSQACIDYLLGNRTTTVFSEFLSKLQSTDPKDMIRLSKIRAAAIETCVDLVLYKGETLIHGWTLMAPLELNVKAGNHFVEKVLLLSAQALYIVNFDYSMLKVKMYTRVPLGDISGIEKGTYILSTLQEASRNPEDNYGFVVNFRPRQTTARVTSYALRNQASTYDSVSTSDAESQGHAATASSVSSRFTSGKGSILSNVLSAASMGPSQHLFAAFKAIPEEIERETRGPDGQEDFIASSNGRTCKQAVDTIVSTIHKACRATGNGSIDNFIIEKDVISLAEAQKLSSVYSKFEYGLKRLLWLGVP